MHVDRAKRQRLPASDLGLENVTPPGTRCNVRGKGHPVSRGQRVCLARWMSLRKIKQKQN